MPGYKTSNDVRRDFDVSPGGRITTPGMFEGEMVWVPFYWGVYLDGYADRDDGEILGFDIAKGEHEAFPEMPKRKRTVRLYQRDDGFVCEC